MLFGAPIHVEVVLQVREFLFRPSNQIKRTVIPRRGICPRRRLGLASRIRRWLSPIDCELKKREERAWCGNADARIVSASCDRT